MVTPKIGLIIQARMASSRLPGKVLLPLPPPHGSLLIAHIIQRALMAAHSPDCVVIATSQNPENKPLAELATLLGIKAYQGDESDVLSRFTHISSQYGFEHVVRLTGDNPFIDPQIIRQSVNEHLEKGVDYSHTEGLPIGMNIEIVRSSALLRSASETTDHAHREHVTSHILSQPSYSKHICRFSSPTVNQLRLTVDYPSDYALACEIFASLHSLNPTFGLQEITTLIQERPWLRLVNSDNWQIKDYPCWEEERDDALKILNQLGMNRAAALIAKSTPP